MGDLIADVGINNIVTVAIGLIMLLFGQRVFWLFVGGMAYYYVSDKMQGSDNSPEAIMAYGLMFGVIASVAAVFLYKITLGTVGFFVGGVGLVLIIQSLDVVPSSYLFTFLMGAALGLIFFTYLFDWTMVLLSSWLGAAYLTSLVPFEDETQRGVALLLLMLIGVMFQGYQLYQRKKK